MIYPRADYYTPFPPQDLHGGEHQMHFREEDKTLVLQWCDEHAGEKGKDYWYPAKHIITFRDTNLRALFKLTWG